MMTMSQVDRADVSAQRRTNRSDTTIRHSLIDESANE
jgi:hypothetical protein